MGVLLTVEGRCIRQRMARETISIKDIGLWAVTALVSLLFMLLFAAVVWPREAPTDEMLARGQAKAEALQLVRQGYQQHWEKEFEKAIGLYSAALERDPDVSRAIYLRGSARMLFGDNEGAYEDFSKMIEVAPSFAPAYNSRGVLRYRRNDVEGALEDFDRSIELNPKFFAKPYVNRGHVKRDLGDAQGALSDYDAACELQPNSRWILDSRGVLKYEQGDVEGALEDFTRATEIPDGSAVGEYTNIYRNRAAIRKEQGDLAGAAEDLARVKKLSG